MPQARFGAAPAWDFRASNRVAIVKREAIHDHYPSTRRHWVLVHEGNQHEPAYAGVMMCQYPCSITLNYACESVRLLRSEKVAGAGCFGASLMLEPELVASCCAAMAAVTSIPITVKCRLGEF